MQQATATVTIEAPPDRVFQFVANPEHLPRWATGFARSVRRLEDGRWQVETPQGPVSLTVAADAVTGVVDFWISPAPDVTVLAASRVIGFEHGTAYTFTQFKPEAMPDELFQAQTRTARAELAGLRRLLEEG